MNIIQLNRISLNSTSLNALGSCEGKAGVKVVWNEGTVEGWDVLFVKDVKANSISSLNVNGGCSQSGTPTPSAPKDIATNKGVIKYVTGKNLLEVRDDNIVVGKYINNAGVPTESLPNIYFQRFVSVKPSTAYTLSASETLNYANFMEYDANGVFIKRTLYGSSTTPAGASVSHTMGDTTAFVIVGSNVNSSKYPSITKDNVKGIKWMFNEGSSALKYEAYNGKVVYEGNDEVSVYGKNLSVGELIGKGYASTGAVSTSTTFCGNLYKFPVAEGQTYTVSWGNVPNGVSGVFINTWKKDGSWNARQAISASDSLKYTIPSGVGEVNFTLYKTGGITIGADTWMQVEFGDVATEFQPAIEPSKASATTLLGVGDFADVQDVVGGVITRKVGYKVLNGYEAVSTSNKAFTISITDKVRSKETLLCSHFSYSTATSSALANNTIIGFASQNVGFRNDNCADIESFRQFLQMEYAKGTPVIVVYPLANEDVENVSTQYLSNPKGDVTIIRDAEVSGLAFNATLKVKGEEQEGGGSGEPITFTVGDTQFEALDGMTWYEWCNNSDGFNTEIGSGWGAQYIVCYAEDSMVITEGAFVGGETSRVLHNGKLMYGTDKIINGGVYELVSVE